MKPTIEQKAPNATIALLRRLAAEKRETKREMREAFKNDPRIAAALRELDKLNGKDQHQSV